VRKLRAANLRRAPGAAFAYANSNYVLLAALVERLSGLPWPVYLRTQVFLPLGMTRTTLDRTEALGWGLAEGHERQWGRVRPSPSRFFGWYGASLVKSTASDLGRFLAAVFGGRAEVVPAGMRLDPPYDWGWFITPKAEWLDGSLLLEHTGDIWGGNTAVLIAPEGKLAVAVLLNAGVDRAGQIARSVLARAAGRGGGEPEVAPRFNDPDFWAICLTVASALILTGLLVAYLARMWGEFRRGERRFAGVKNWWVRARIILLLAMAGCLLVLALDGGGPPPASLPSTVRLAWPLFAASFAGVLTVAALLSPTARS
jgi:CubicO group peptidase (beta-lactamase class C family)